MWWPVVGTSSLARQISGVGRRWSEPPPCPEFEMERCTESLPSCQHRHRLRLISEPSVPHRTAVTSSSSRKQRRISPFFPFAAADAHASSHAPHVVGVLCFSPPPISRTHRRRGGHGSRARRSFQTCSSNCTVTSIHSSCTNCIVQLQCIHYPRSVQSRCASCYGSQSHSIIHPFLQRNSSSRRKVLGRWQVNPLTASNALMLPSRNEGIIFTIIIFSEKMKTREITVIIRKQS